MKSIRFEENISYMGWPHCLRLSNAEVELMIATDIGIRSPAFRFYRRKEYFLSVTGGPGKNRW